MRISSRTRAMVMVVSSIALIGGASSTFGAASPEDPSIVIPDGECLWITNILYGASSPIGMVHGAGGGAASIEEAVYEVDPSAYGVPLDISQLGPLAAEVKTIGQTGVMGIYQVLNLGTPVAPAWVASEVTSSAPCDGTDSGILAPSNEDPPPGEVPGAPRTSDYSVPDPDPAGEMILDSSTGS